MMLLLVWLRSVKQQIQKQVEMDHLDLKRYLYLILLCFLLEGYSTASSSEKVKFKADCINNSQLNLPEL